MSYESVSTTAGVVSVSVWRIDPKTLGVEYTLDGVRVYWHAIRLDGLTYTNVVSRALCALRISAFSKLFGKDFPYATNIDNQLLDAIPAGRAD